MANKLLVEDPSACFATLTLGKPQAIPFEAKSI